MRDPGKWTQEDTIKQNNLIADATAELIKIASDFEFSCMETEKSDVSWSNSEGCTKKYDAIRLLRQIEGLQQILVYHGAKQPVTCLPFLADYAVEYVKKHGTVGAHRCKGG